MDASVILSSPPPPAIAMEENLHGHIAFVQRSVSSMMVSDTDTLLIVDSGLPTDTFNKIARARMDKLNADCSINAAMAHFEKAQRPFAWWVGPRSRPFDLEKRLRERGLQAAETDLGMVMELRNLPYKIHKPENLVVRRVHSLQELTDFAEVVAANWEPPDRFVARRFPERS